MAGTQMTKDEARHHLKSLLETGRSNEALVEEYSTGAENYEAMVGALNYQAPANLAAAAAEILKDNYGARIMDAGAGSGLAADELHKLGYKNIDALDPAKDLLEIARAKGVYKNLFCQYLGKDPVPVEDGAYDMSVVCGAYSYTLIPTEGFLELFRITKKGGCVINVCRELPEGSKKQEDTFDFFMDSLVKKGVTKLVSRTQFPGFLENMPGLVYVFEKL